MMFQESQNISKTITERSKNGNKYIKNQQIFQGCPKNLRKLAKHLRKDQET